MIHVVCAKTRTYQFLDEIGLLVRPLRRSESGKPLRAVFLTDPIDPFRCLIKGFFPTRFAKMSERICRIDFLVRIFGDAVFADQRRREAVRMMDIVEAEAALHAQPVAVGRTFLAINIQKLAVL